jgi:hypothetical protein
MWNCYAFPPLPLLPRVLEKVEQVDLILIAPWWPRAPWFPLILDLLADLPIILSKIPDLLTHDMGPQGMIRRQDLQSLHLTAWRLNGKLSVRRAFQSWRLEPQDFPDWKVYDSRWAAYAEWWGDELGHRNLLQVSLDGRNVNLLLFQKLQHEMESLHGVKLLDVGTCGLHTLHNGFKGGFYETKWEVSHFRSCLHTLFDETPARRQDFEEAVGSVVCEFPLPFTNHRWLENVNVANRAVVMLPHLKQYIKSVEKQTQQIQVLSHLNVSK